jgi:polyhydroxybutyrate depolymerase
MVKKLVLLSVALTLMLTPARVVAAGKGEHRAHRRPKHGTREQTLVHQKLTRKYQLHIPASYDGTRAVPLVLALHGMSGNGLLFLRKGWGKKADSAGFILVCPDATGDPSAWNSGYNNGRNYPVDDVDFLRVLLDRMQKRFRIDPGRVYVTGLSSGAMMSYRLAAELSGRIAAIAPVAGSIGAHLKDQGGQRVQVPDPRGPVSVIALHGKLDTNVPYDGSTGRAVNFLPVADSIAFWVKHDGCAARPKRLVSKDGKVIEERYGGGQGGTEVVLLTVLNGDHHSVLGKVYPGGKDAIDVIWTFFARHARNQ